jgi:hypothetical protein
MTPCPDLVAEAPRFRPDVLPFEWGRLSRDRALRGGPCADTQTHDAHASTGPQDAAFDGRETGTATRQAIVSDGRAGSSRPSLLESTPVFVQPSPEAPEMNITGNHMLLALALAFCLAGPLAWAFVRYWLFAL